MGSSFSKHHTGNMIKAVLLLSVLGLALALPLPDDAVALPYILPYHAGVYPYAGVPLVYAAPLESGLVYPVAEAYVHDPTGDVSDDRLPRIHARSRCAPPRSCSARTSS